PPPSTLFPYTTLFRSFQAPLGGHRTQPPDHRTDPAFQQLPQLRFNPSLSPGLAHGFHKPLSLKDLRSNGRPDTNRKCFARNDLRDRKSTRLNSSHLGI